MAGISTALNLSSQQENPDDNSKDVFRVTKNNLYYELGIGIDLYLTWFKFTPSIRGVFSMQDELIKDVDPNSRWTRNISQMQTRGLFINFTFQGALAMVAFYLQKYVVYRKRKIYVGKRNFQDLSPLIKKYKDEKFLLPSSDKLKPLIPNTLEEIGVQFKQAVFYKTVISDLSDLANVYYDILVFFSPSGIESLISNFPDFKQNDTRIAVFGKTTVKAAEKAGLRIDILAPTPKVPSMSKALDIYIEKANKK